MKQIIKKLLVLTVLLSAFPSWAYSFCVDGIYYGKNSDGKTVYVTYETTSYNSYSGSVVIPSTVTYSGTTYSVTSIGNSAFEDCSGLTSVTIPNSVTSIGDDAFYKCSGLKQLTIQDGTSTLSLGYNLKGSSLSSVGQGLFHNAPLESVYLGRNLSYYTSYSGGYSPFNYKSTIKELTIGNSVTTIGSYAFNNCSGLTSVTIPNSVTSIGSQAFYGTAWYNNQPDGLVYAGKVAYKYKGTIPENTSITIKDGTLSITGSAFSGCSGLTLVTIPNSVTSIGYKAFYNCSGLTSVTIGNSVTEIGSSAFSGTAWYNNQPDGLVYAGKVAYRYKGNMPENTSITIKDGTLSITDSAFSGCSGLTSVTIPNSVTSIGGGAFNGCSGLTSVTIGNSVTEIGADAFKGCSALTKVEISDIAAWCKISFVPNDNYVYSNPLTYADHLFLNGKEVTKLIIPNSVTSISNCAFFGFRALTSVAIPNSVTSIGNSAFAHCSGLMSLAIPNSVTSIGQSAFYNCSGLTSVTIGNSVTSIGNYAFYNCSGLTSVTIGYSVTEIGEYAFYGCSKILSFTSQNATPPTLPSEGVFEGMPRSCQLYVPASSKVAYQTAVGWTFFTFVNAFGEGDIATIDSDSVGVTAAGDAIRVEGAEGAEAEVYSLSGALLYRGTDSTIALPRGIYIVKVAGTTTKVIL